MPAIDTGATVGRLVAEDISRAEVFERWGIDFCCGGGAPLESACAKKGIPLSDLVKDLETRDSVDESEASTDWATASVTALADHIVATHHEFLREELPRLGALAHKVADAHGDRHPELLKISELFSRLSIDMFTHSSKEELILFPYIREMDSRSDIAPRPFGSVKNPILAMESDHDEAGAILARLRSLSRDYEAPSNACASYRALYHGLERLERDLHLHIHKENNILFPRAIALESNRESG